LQIPLHEVYIWILEPEIGIEIPEIWWRVTVCEVCVCECLVP
jgi:hypothetical protein